MENKEKIKSIGGKINTFKILFAIVIVIIVVFTISIIFFYFEVKQFISSALLPFVILVPLFLALLSYFLYRYYAVHLYKLKVLRKTIDWFNKQAENKRTDLYGMMAEYISEGTNANYTAVYILNNEKTKYQLEATQDINRKHLSGEYDADELSFPKNKSGEVKPITIENKNKVKRKLPAGEISINHYCYIPLQNNNENAGFIELGFQNAIPRKTEKYIEVVSPVFSLMTSKITNTTTSSDVEKKKNEEAFFAQKKVIEELSERINELKHEIDKQTNTDTKNLLLKNSPIINVSQELVNPLNSILEYSKKLQKDGELPEKYDDFINGVQKSAFRLKNIVHALLGYVDTTNNISGNEKVVQLEDMKNEIKNEFENIITKHDLKFTISLSSDLPETVTTNTVKVKQIVAAIISNALKYTNKGNIDVKIKAPNPLVNLADSMLSAETAFCISITDTGIGIPKPEHEKIFSGFYQIDNKQNKEITGLGLGLAFAQDTAKKLGGEIQLKSLDNEGSTFDIYLPINPNNQKGNTKVNEDVIAVKEHKDKKIAICEKNEIVSEILKPFLEDKNVEMVTKNTIEECEKLAEEYQLIALILFVEDSDEIWPYLDKLRQNKASRDIPVFTISEKTVTESVESPFQIITEPLNENKVEAMLNAFKKKQSADAGIIALTQNVTETKLKDLLQNKVDKITVFNAINQEQETHDILVFNLEKDLDELKNKGVFLEMSKTNKQMAVAYIADNISETNEQFLQEVVKATSVRQALLSNPELVKAVNYIESILS